MHVSVLLPSGKRLQVRAKPETKIGALKRCVEEKEGILAHQVAYLMDGKALDDSRTFDYYDITTDCEIDVVFHLSGQGDMLANHLASSYPANNSSNVPVTTSISITFDDSVHNVTPAGLELTPPVSGTCSFDATKRTLLFSPAHPLRYNTKYSTQLPSDVKVSGTTAYLHVVLISFTTTNPPPPKKLKIFGDFLATQQIILKDFSKPYKELLDAIKQLFGSQSFDIEMELSVRVRDTPSESGDVPLPQYTLVQSDFEVLELENNAEIRVKFTSKPPLPHSMEDSCAVFSTLFEGFPSEKIRSNGLRGNVLVEVMMNESDRAQRDVLVVPLALNLLQFRVLQHHFQQYK